MAISAATVCATALVLAAQPRAAASAPASPPGRRRRRVSTASSIRSPPSIIDERHRRAPIRPAPMLVVIVLRTPGGLLDSTRTIVSRMITSRAPVVVFVGPSGARAASAGFIITLAADVAVDGARHAHRRRPSGVGAAATADGRDDVEEGGVRRRGLRAHRSPRRAAATSTLAAEAVTESRAFTDARGARRRRRRSIDFVAPRRRRPAAPARRPDDHALRRPHGRRSHTAGAAIAARRDDAAAAVPQRHRASADRLPAAHARHARPDRGAVESRARSLPGVAGGLCLLLAFFAFQMLPVNTTGLLLIVFGLALLVLELKVPSFGVLGVGGTVSLVDRLGDDDARRARHPRRPAASSCPAALALAGDRPVPRPAGAARRSASRRSTGADALIGAAGAARTPLAPGAPGQVDVHGEIWRADEPRRRSTPATPVRVARGQRPDADRRAGRRVDAPKEHTAWKA